MKIEIEFSLLEEIVEIVIDCKMDEKLAKEFIRTVVMDMIDPKLTVTIDRLPDGF